MHMAHLDNWLNDHSRRVERCETRHETGRALRRALMNDDSERFDELRYRVLFQVLARRLEQREADVTNLLRQEVLGRVGATIPEEAAEEDGLPNDTVPAGVANARPLAELVVLAVDELDRDEHWGALAEEERNRPTTWLAQLVFWRLRDRLRPKRDSAGPERETRAHHRVASWLEILAEADPELDGALVALRGLHRSVLRRVREHLAEEGSAGTAYALRKLFPVQAWPPEDPSGVGDLATWLLGSVDHLFATRADRSAAVDSLIDFWAVGSMGSVREGLEHSARHHLLAATFPSLREVACWCGDDPWLGRKIGRVGAEIEPFVEAAIRRVRAELGAS